MTEEDRQDILLLERVQFILSIALIDMEKVGKTKRFAWAIPNAVGELKHASQKLRVTSRVIAEVTEHAA